MNGWFVNILPPLKFPSLPCSHAPSLPRSIPPPLTSSLPSFPRAVHASFGPFLARSLHQPSHLTLPSSTDAPSLPPSLPPLPPSALTRSATAPPIQLKVGLHRVCVWCWRAALSRSDCLAPSDVWHWHNGGIHSCRRRSFNDRCFIQRRCSHHESVFDE